MVNIWEVKSLKNHLLVAMPTLYDPIFQRAVAYVCEHDEQGAMALVINKPMKMTLGDVLAYLKITTDNAAVNNHPVLMGGPLGQEQGFIIRRDMAKPESATDFVISSSKETLETIASTDNHDPLIICLGYSSWTAGQLEQEIGQNSWLIASADTKILFETPFEQRWRAAALSTGVDFNFMANDIGHA